MPSGSSKRISLALALAVFIATWIRPNWPVEQALHSSLTLVAFVWLALHDRKWNMRARDFVIVCVFIAVHCVAARWLYTNVPYDAWLQRLAGWSPQQAFGWQRNHADRLIHLLYGLCFMPAIHAYLRQRWPLRFGQAYVLGILLVMASSLLYEWLEWGIALTLSPEQAEAYNGQQGDMWDAHMDMLLATIGACLTWPWLDRTTRGVRAHA